MGAPASGMAEVAFAPLSASTGRPLICDLQNVCAKFGALCLRFSILIGLYTEIGGRQYALVAMTRLILHPACVQISLATDIVTAVSVQFPASLVSRGLAVALPPLKQPIWSLMIGQPSPSPALE